MNGTEKIVKHLEMIQAIVNRLGNNGFLVKGGSLAIIITAAVLVDREPNIVSATLTFTILMPIILGFWTLDGYFLWQERLFRQVYEEIRQRDDTDFKMDVGKHRNKPKCNRRSAIFSQTLLIFYSIEVLFVCAIAYLL